MKKQVKTLISALLALILTFSFAACQTSENVSDASDGSDASNISEYVSGAFSDDASEMSDDISGDTSSISDSDTSKDETSNPDETSTSNETSKPNEIPKPERPNDSDIARILNAATQKTKSAKSLTVKLNTLSIIGDGNTKANDEYTQNVYIGNDGSYTSVLTGKYCIGMFQDKIEYEELCAYYDGNEGYEITYYSDGGEKGYDFYISDEALSEEIIWKYFTYNTPLLYSRGLWDRFVSANPSVKENADGSTNYILTNLSYERLFEIIGLPDVGEPNESVAPHIAGEISSSVDKNGYLTSLAFSLSANSDEVMSYAYTFSRFNENAPMKKPEKISSVLDRLNKDYSFLENMYYCTAIHYDKGFGAMYNLRGGFFDDVEIGLELTDLQGKQEKDIVVPVYIASSEICGIPIKYISMGSYEASDTNYIERLVVPDGVMFIPSSDMSKTEIFFKDKREVVEALGSYKLYTASDTPIEGGVLVKGAYYAGEWEMVDGVPTPKK